MKGEKLLGEEIVMGEDDRRRRGLKVGKKGCERFWSCQNRSSSKREKSGKSALAISRALGESIGFGLIGGISAVVNITNIISCFDKILFILYAIFKVKAGG